MEHNILIKGSSRYPIHRKEIKKTVVHTLEAMQVFEPIEVEIEIIGDRKMRAMKKEHLGIDETTDVLSFPLTQLLGKKPAEGVNFPENPSGFTQIGTILVSYPQAQRQANAHHLMIDEEINQLVEHGVLHLIGVHHD